MSHLDDTLENIVELGGGYRYCFTQAPDGTQNAGMLFEHPRPDNEQPCAGALDFEPHGRPGQQWSVTSWEPLTLSPSIHCRACGRHGYIRNGCWVEA
jgi:hypothetical protein